MSTAIVPILQMDKLRQIIQLVSGGVLCSCRGGMHSDVQPDDTTQVPRRHQKMYCTYHEIFHASGFQAGQQMREAGGVTGFGFNCG